MILSWPVWAALQRVFFEILHELDEPLAGMVLYHDPDDRYGYQEERVIWINTAYSPPEIIQTILHEIHHLQQDPDRTDEEQYELEANQYANQHFTTWHERFQHLLEEIRNDQP